MAASLAHNARRRHRQVAVLSPVAQGLASHALVAADAAVVVVLVVRVVGGVEMLVVDALLRQKKRHYSVC